MVLFDVRAGEARGKLVGITLVLLLVISGHTVLETARDAMLLTGPGPLALGFVYMLIPAATLPGTALAARAGERFGQRPALASVLVVAVLGPLALFAIPTSHATAIATYVLSGALGSVVVPQFWTLASTSFTLSEGRRLFGIISSGGIVGGVIGPALASAVLLIMPVKTLLVVSSAVFAMAGGALGLVRLTQHPEKPGSMPRVPLSGSVRAFREQPFLARVALVVGLSTATFLSMDYLFKSTVARSMPSARVAPFVAHSYLALNGASLLVQLFLSRAVVRRLGMLASLVLTPLLLVGGAAVALGGRGALPGVLLAKGIDGSLRYSIHRMTAELVYLPLPSSTRQRAKPLIDGGLGRTSQTLTGAALLALGGTSLLGPRSMPIVVLGLAGAWLAAVVTMRAAYLRLLRTAIKGRSLGDSGSVDTIDVNTAQMLVQRLASVDPREVEGAMAALSRHGRSGSIPATVLLREDEEVLVRALEAFGASPRTDWYAQARRLLHHRGERVRVAATRALARHEQLDPSSLMNDVGWREQGYVAVRMGLRDPEAPVLEQASVAGLLGLKDENGEVARLGMLAAIADSPRLPRLRPVLGRLAQPGGSQEKMELLATAAARQGDPLLVPVLVSSLSRPEGRDAVRSALVALGQPALDEVVRTLRDPTIDEQLRLHMPKTLAQFASGKAVDPLIDEIESGPDGLVRFKAIQALRQLVTENHICVERTRMERLSCHDLEKHFESLGLRLVLEACSSQLAAARLALLVELLRERAAYSLERAFNELQIAHPHQGVHHAYIALRAGDSHACDNAEELLETMLRRRDQQRLRRLFRLAMDDLSIEERTGRARRYVSMIPCTLEEAVARLVRSRNKPLAALGMRL